MTKLSITEPELGTKNSVADPRIPAALKEIEKVVNGELEGTTNFKAEGILEGNLSKELQEKLTTKLGLKVELKNESLTGVSEHLYLMEKEGSTLELPAPTLNRVIGVLYNVAAGSCKVKASSGKIYGDFVTGATTLTLLPYQHVLVFASGFNWFILAGEPKREAALTEIEKTRTSGTEYEPSAMRPSNVTVQVNLGSGGGALVFFINGAKVGEWAIGAGTELDMPVTLPPLNPGDKWKFTTLSGTPTVSSTYRIL